MANGGVKKILLIVSIVFILLFGGLRLLIYKFEPTKEIELRLKAASLPDLDLTLVDGTTFVLPPGEPIVLIYFNSECDHCQRQINALKSNLAMFEGISVVLMSAQPYEEVVAFASTLGTLQNIRVVQCKPEEIAEKFGVLSLPQIFVYDAKGALAGLFYGETGAAVIRGALAP